MKAKRLLIDLIGFASIIIPAVIYNLLEKEHGWLAALLSITPILIGINYVWRRSLR
jgi:hypothetical protein